MLARLWAALAGLDGPGKRALPIGEFLHPVALACVIVLALNDHVLKGAGLLPPLVTGKISDFAGLAFFPLVLTAVTDLFLLGLARAGLRIDFSLRLSKLVVAIALTGASFAAIKLSPALAARVADLLSAVAWTSAIVADPTDLIALLALVVPLWIGRAELRRVPLGRLEAITRLGWRDRDELCALIADVGDRQTVESLADALDNYRASGEPERLETTLAEIRGGAFRASRPGMD